MYVSCTLTFLLFLVVEHLGNILLKPYMSRLLNSLTSCYFMTLYCYTVQEVQKQESKKLTVK